MHSVRDRFDCRSCAAGNLDYVGEMRRSPLGDAFRPLQEQAMNQPSFRLPLGICRVCALLQLTIDVDPGDIYGDYLYTTQTTPALSQFYAQLASALIRDLDLEESKLVIDIGSNDGSGLAPFHAAGMSVTGVEPAPRPALIARERGIPTIQDFLTTETRDQILSKLGPAKLITANFMLANVSEPSEMLSLMASILSSDGVISVITGYHPDQFSVNMFEYVNHDHLSYFTVASFNEMAEACGLTIARATRLEHKGGSIHFLLVPSGSTHCPSDGSVTQLKQREKWLDVNDPIFFQSFLQRVNSAKSQFWDLVRSIGTPTFSGIGASISTTHLLHEFEMGELVEEFFDDDPAKVGLFSPGFGIQVRSLSEIHARKAESVLLLAWQHSAALIGRLQTEGLVGKVILPLPSPKVLSLP